MGGKRSCSALEECFELDARRRAGGGSGRGPQRDSDRRVGRQRVGKLLLLKRDETQDALRVGVYGDGCRALKQVGEIVDSGVQIGAQAV